MTQQALQHSGLWPAGQPTGEAARIGPGENLLPLLAAVWRRVGPCRSSRECRLHSDTADHIQKHCDRGAVLSLGIPGRDRPVLAPWIGERFAWWPDGIPTQRRVALLSSHLGNAPESRAVWFTALRAACSKVDAANDLLVTATGVTTDRFVRRCQELFNIPLLDVVLPKRTDSSWSNWAKSILENNLPPNRPGIFRLFLSPEQSDVCEKPQRPRGPLADRAIISLSDQLVVLSLKRRGRLLPLIEKRVGDRSCDFPSVLLAIGGDMIPSRIAGPLLDRGAVGWILLDPVGASRRDSQPVSKKPGDMGPAGSGAPPIIPVPAARQWQYLTHWTRRRVGPWPDQHEQEFLDDLILQRQASDHSALSALKRILTQRRIAASSDAIRGSTGVVSFTSLPLQQFPNQRVFRSHRGRWDFELCGICIRRDWLERQGARPVIYGDESTWNQLSDVDRPFFQLEKSGSGENLIRWRDEREWRHVGSVDLSTVPEDAALVFVPSGDDAESIAENCHWPIVVLSTSTDGLIGRNRDAKPKQA